MLPRNVYMHKILEFLATDGTFLYEEHCCCIVDSEYSEMFGGTGSVTLSNDIIELKFWLDRDRMCMDLHGVGSHTTDSWFSMDIVKQLLTDEVNDKSLMNHENVEFLKENFEDLQDRFASPNLPASESTCRKLERQRAKRIFG